MSTWPNLLIVANAPVSFPSKSARRVVRIEG